jgi:hypothetical protein
MRAAVGVQMPVGVSREDESRHGKEVLAAFS